jgi:hypothetical protein
LGSKGIIEIEDGRTLLTFMCVKGFTTNSDTPGVEKLVVQKPSLLDGPYTTPTFLPNCLPCGGVGYTKGWTRGVMALFMAEQILKQKLIDHVSEESPHVVESLRSVFVVVGEYADETEKVLENRSTPHIRDRK